MKRDKLYQIAITVLLAVLASSFALPVWAGDNPPDPQDPGEHSTVATANGEHIRDDDLAETVRENLPEDDDGIHCKDVKIFVQCCHGGGLLDDFDRVLSPPHTPPGGVAWVGGSAADPEEFSWGPNDAWCAANPPTGDYWTDTLIGNMGGGTISDSLDSTASADPAASGGSANTQYGIEEHPQSNSNNGGSGIAWGEGGSDPDTNHEVVVFSGDTETRHQHDCDNFESACNDMWGANANVSKTTGGTKQQLVDAIKAACANLDDNTQLVIYISGHGDTDFDVLEFLNDVLGEEEDDPVTVDPVIGPVELQAPLHDGWVNGFAQSAAQGETPTPYLTATFGNVVNLDQWEWSFNEMSLPVGGTYAPGETIELALDPAEFVYGINIVTLTPLDPTGAPMILENMELCSGDFNNGMTFPELKGDLDDSGWVGQPDLDIVLDQWGCGEPPKEPITDSRADPNGDGWVGQPDLDIVLDDWGLHGPPPPAGDGGGETLALPSTLASEPVAEVVSPSKGNRRDKSTMSSQAGRGRNNGRRRALGRR